MQLLDKDNNHLAIGSMSRGEHWVAYYVDSDQQVCEVTVKAGMGFIQTVQELFSKFDPFKSSIATTKQKGSDTVVEDDELLVQWQLNGDRIRCRHKLKGFQVGVPREGEMQCVPIVWATGNSVTLPSWPLIKSCRKFFEATEFPGDDWFEDKEQLRAFKSVDVYTVKDEHKRNTKIASIRGCSSTPDGPQLGNFVQISFTYTDER